VRLEPALPDLRFQSSGSRVQLVGTVAPDTLSRWRRERGLRRFITPQHEHEHRRAERQEQDARHGQKLRLAQVDPPPTVGAQQPLTQSLLRWQLSAHTPSTQKPSPARKLQQSPFTEHTAFTLRHDAPHCEGAEHARSPLTSAAQHPLLHSELATQESAQRPLTQNPVPCWNVQQSPLTAQVAPRPTQLAGSPRQLNPLAV
jgi:hypothetical protein